MTRERWKLPPSQAWLIVVVVLITGLAVWMLAPLALWFPTPLGLRLAAAAFLSFFLPGWLLLRAIPLATLDRLERLVLAIGLGYGLIVVGSLGGLYLFSALSIGIVVGLLGLLVLLLLLVIFFSSGSSLTTYRPLADKPQITPLFTTETLIFAIPVAVAAFFSFTNLGYSDYWGDEMNGLLRAISIIGGRVQTLFEHTKGPVEVLLPANFGLLVGRFEPFTVRFPFALAHIVGTGGYYLLGRRLFGQYVGLIAALLLALNGLYLAFGRMVQYQAVVFMMTSLALLLAYHFYKTDRSRYLFLSLFLAGVGLLAHYDMLLVLPPIAYLVWLRYGLRWSRWKARWLTLAGAGLIFLAVVALFYIPFFLHPHLAKTSSYLNRIIGASNWPGNNFDQLYVFAVMYNSRYYVAFVALLGLGLVAVHLSRLLRQRYRDKALWSVVALTLFLGLLALAVGRPSFGPVLLSMLLFVLLVAFSSLSPELKLVYVWLGVSLVGYVYFIDHPRTHPQIIYPGWTLLVALALTKLATRLQNRMRFLRYRWATVAAIFLLGLLFGLFAYYEYLLFVDSRREYIFTYPEHKQPLYWEDPQFPFGSRRLYGAPHRLGWQMINQLYLEDRLGRDWHSNDDGSNLFWYTLGAPRNPCYPHYYFLTQFDQQEDEEELPELAGMGYVKIGQVWNRDRLQADIYEFAPLGQADESVVWREPPGYRSFVTPGDFYSLPYELSAEAGDTQPATPLPDPPAFKPNSAALQQIADRYGDPRIVNVADKVALLGYDLNETWVRPGGVILLTLYWQPLEVVNLPYKIFVHLENDGQTVVAQADDFPACGTRPTRQWDLDEVVTDRHSLPLPADLPPGEYTLRVGLYEPQTGLRMDRLDPLGNPQGVSFELTRIILPSQE